MTNKPTPPPVQARTLTAEQIAVLARHAGEFAQLQAEQHNARVELLERHRQEAAEVGISAPPSIVGR